MTISTATGSPPPPICKQCAAPNGTHAAFCETAVSNLLDCIDRRHAFVNLAPTGEKPLWECTHCGEPRITPTEYPRNTPTGLSFGPARIGGGVA